MTILALPLPKKLTLDQISTYDTNTRVSELVSALQVVRHGMVEAVELRPPRSVTTEYSAAVVEARACSSLKRFMGFNFVFVLPGNLVLLLL